jgi:hypothetical protein
MIISLSPEVLSVIDVSGGRNFREGSVLFGKLKPFGEAFVTDGTVE